VIWIYALRSSVGARVLTEGLVAAGQLARRWRSKGKFRPGAGDIVIGWGETPPSDRCLGALVINAKQVHSKVRELDLLAAAKIPCPKLSITRQEGWLPRSPHHTGGLDLLKGLTKGEVAYYTQKLPLIKEFRVHIFRKPGGELVSIRAGSKVPREDVPVEKRSSWIRSWDGGWKMSYGVGNREVTSEMRDLARRAVEKLGLDFGAVDVGVLESGGLVVLEVNKAPGLEGGTVEAYVRAITQLLPSSTEKKKAA
jgi:hypothetical protein